MPETTLKPRHTIMCEKFTARTRGWSWEVGPSTSGGWMAPRVLPRLSSPSFGFSLPDARLPAPHRHGPSQTGHIPAPAIADRRAQSRFLSRVDQCDETKSDCLAHPVGDCPRLRFC